MEMRLGIRNRSIAQLRYHAAIVFAIGLLLFSWFVWYLCLMALTEGWGAPWDTTDIRPPIGHWQRTINDFFESGIGVNLPAAVFLTSSILLYIRSLARTRNVQAVSLVFGFTNLLALFTLFFLGYLMQVYFISTPTHLTPDDWSYWGDFRREWPLSVMLVVVCTTLLLLQPHLLRRYFIGITKS